MWSWNVCIPKEIVDSVIDLIHLDNALDCEYEIVEVKVESDEEVEESRSMDEPSLTTKCQQFRTVPEGSSNELQLLPLPAPDPAPISTVPMPSSVIPSCMPSSVIPSWWFDFAVPKNYVDEMVDDGPLPLPAACKGMSKAVQEVGENQCLNHPES